MTVITRTIILNDEIKKRKVKTYLEIGYGNGENLGGIKCKAKEAVDPFAPPEGSKHGKIHHMTSDAFFEQYNDHVDMIFIDGDHSYSQATKDLESALKHINKGGIVVMHDTCPKDHNYSTEGWCGGVFRVISDLANSRKRLDWWTIPEDHGVTFIKRSIHPNKPTGLTIETFEQWDEHKDLIMRFKQYEAVDTDLHDI